MSDFTLGIISLVSFLLGAFFSGCETAFIAADRIRLRHFSDQGNKGAKIVLSYLDNPQYFMSSVLVGTNLAVIGCTTTFTAIMASRYGDSGATVAVAVLVPMFLVFNEMLPKGVFLYYASKAAIASSFPLRIFSFVLFPIIKTFSFATDFLIKLSGMELQSRRLTLTMEELLFHMEDSEEAGMISKETMLMVSRAIQLKKLKAAEVMLPLDKVMMVEQGLSVAEYEDHFAKERFSRLPVYKGDRTNVVGIISIHNLIEAGEPRGGRLELEAPYIVPGETSIVKMLILMKNQGCHMALIEDERGKTAGMLTLEDILERLVGAIADEFH